MNHTTFIYAIQVESRKEKVISNLFGAFNGVENLIALIIWFLLTKRDHRPLSKRGKRKRP